MKVKVPTPRGSQKRLTDYNDKLIGDLCERHNIKDIRVVTSKDINYIGRRAEYFHSLGYRNLFSGWIGGEYNQSGHYLEGNPLI